MGISRYDIAGRLAIGNTIASSTNMSKINVAVLSGKIDCNVHVLQENQRLDHIAGLAYNDSSYWWIIAAASGIGWGLQVPPGTIIKIPNDVSKIIGILS